MNTGRLIEFGIYESEDEKQVLRATVIADNITYFTQDGDDMCYIHLVDGRRIHAKVSYSKLRELVLGLKDR